MGEGGWAMMAYPESQAVLLEVYVHVDREETFWRQQM